MVIMPRRHLCGDAHCGRRVNGEMLAKEGIEPIVGRFLEELSIVL